MTGQSGLLANESGSASSSEPTVNYVDLRVRISALDERAGAYPVEAQITDTHGSVSRVGGAFFAPDWSRLHDLESEIEAYGQYLFYTLYSGPMASVYDRAAGIAEESADNRLRQHIWIADDAPELHAIYWESMQHQRSGMVTPVSTVLRTPFSRYVDVDFASSQPGPLNHLRLLYVCANPLNLQSKYNLAPIDVETEIQQVISALILLRHSRQLAVTVVPGITGISQDLRKSITDLGWQVVDGLASVSTVMSHLTGAPGYQVVHFLGHGRYSQKNTAATLYFEGQSGNAHIVKDSELGARMMALDRVPDMVFLAACESAIRHPELGYPQVGFAPQLIRAGVKAVVAMQGTINTQTARMLTTEFYQSVFDHGLVDVALNKARFTVYTEGYRDWWVPALATCLQDGALFKPDRVRSMLDAMTDSDLYNPLPSDADYIPCDVTHRGNVRLPLEVQEITGQREEIGWVFDRLLGIPGDADIPFRKGAPVVILAGAGGMGKSVQLKRLGYTTAADSWYADSGISALPVYVDLSDTPIRSVRDIELLCYANLKSFQDDLDFSTFSGWLDGDGPDLRYLFDGMDGLQSSQRGFVSRLLALFIGDHPWHQFVIAYDEKVTDLHDFRSELEIANQAASLDIVHIQALSELALTSFLRAHSSDASQLAQVIVDKKLTDLAVMPWVLVKLLDDARRHIFPQTLTTLAGDLLAQSVDAISPDASLRLAILRSLYAIAYAMHAGYTSALGIDELFTILQSVRSNREYDLELMFTRLCEENILTLVNGDRVRFTRNVFQVYGCAAAINENVASQTLITDIAATFGVTLRLRWWRDVFVFLAGFGLDVTLLLQQILYGNSIHSSGMLVLAARILQEYPDEANTTLRQYVISSLVYQLGLERDINAGVEIVDALAGFGLPQVLDHLVKIALRDSAVGALAVSSSTRIQLQAANALRRLDAPDFQLTLQASVELAHLLGMWQNSDVTALAQYLVDQDAAGGAVDTQSIAIFALADMRSTPAFDIIMQAFIYPDASEQTLLAITTAVALVNPEIVLNRLLLPFIETEGEGVYARLDEKQYARLKPHILNAAALSRISDERIRAFAQNTLIHDTCIEHKLAAVHVLGAAHNRDSKLMLEQIAVRDFSALDDGASMCEADALRMQKDAIRALTSLADAASLVRLAPVMMDAQVGAEIYQLTEAILWREHNQSAELL